LSFAVLLVSGCDIQSGEEDENSPAPPPIEVDEGEFLALSHLDEKPVREAGEVTTLAQNFMRNMVKSSGSNAVIVGAPEVLNTSIEAGFVVAGSDAESDVSPSDLPFYRYTTRDPATNTTGMMIVSGDKRLGGVLAYIEDDADNPDPASDAFMGMIISNLAAYTQTVIDEYNSVSPEEIEAVLQKADGKTIALSASVSPWSVSRNTEIVTVQTPFLPLTHQTQWDQGEGYWGILNIAEGRTASLAGSAAVAMGQIMAYHEWPEACSIQASIHNPFKSGSYGSLATVVYDWDAMKAVSRVSDEMTNNGQLGVNTLLYEAGKNAEADYGTNGAVKIENILGAFAKMGYDTSRSTLRDYSYEAIVTSITHYQPVIVSAAAIQNTVTETWTTTEHCWLDIFHWFDKEIPHSKSWLAPSDYHFWVIDDYETRATVDTVTTAYGVKETKREADYVHCNFGEGGSKNGWYPDRMFNTNIGPVDDVQRSISDSNPAIQRKVTSTPTGGTKGYYQYDMRIIPYLQPKYN
jgi:hypothetical protein